MIRNSIKVKSRNYTWEYEDDRKRVRGIVTAAAVHSRGILKSQGRNDLSS